MIVARRGDAWANLCMSAEVRDRIVELFERHRETPGAPYDERRFLEFLRAEPACGGELHFIEEVQLEFAVCFSTKDWESTYSLDQFAARGAKLQHSPRGSLRSLRNQLKAGSGIGGLILLVDSALLGIGSLVRDIPWALMIVAIIAVTVNAFSAWFSWRARKYLRTLKQRIEELVT